MLLVLLVVDYSVLLCWVQDVWQVCFEVYGLVDEDLVVLLCELLVVISVYEWCKKGILVLVVEGCIYLYFGVFLLVCGEYVDLVVKVLLLEVCELVFDIGMGFGIIVVIFVCCGIQWVVVIDQDWCVLQCVMENV